MSLLLIALSTVTNHDYFIAYHIKFYLSNYFQLSNSSSNYFGPSIYSFFKCHSCTLFIFTIFDEILFGLCWTSSESSLIFHDSSTRSKLFRLSIISARIGNSLTKNSTSVPFPSSDVSFIQLDRFFAFFAFFASLDISDAGGSDETNPLSSFSAPTIFWATVSPSPVPFMLMVSR